MILSYTTPDSGIFSHLLLPSLKTLADLTLTFQKLILAESPIIFFVALALQLRSNRGALV